MTGRRQRGRKERRKKRTNRVAAGPQVFRESTLKIKMDLVVLTFTLIYTYLETLP